MDFFAFILPYNIKLLENALTHSSYANEVHSSYGSNERLEFLGDAVLDLVIADYLYSNQKEKEGEMTKIRASYVCENALYEYSIRLGLNEELRLGKGEEDNDGRYRKAIVADIFESFIGAMYLDQGIEKMGWGAYKEINLKFTNQVIGVKR